MAQAVHLIIKTGRSSWPYCGRVTTAASGVVVDDRGRFGDYSDLADGITCKWCRKRILGPTTAPTGERVPSARWEPARDVGSDGDVRLFARPFCAGASLAGPWTVIMMAERPDGVAAYTIVASGIATSKRAAQLAAEDALISVRDEITAAVGR